MHFAYNKSELTKLESKYLLGQNSSIKIGQFKETRAMELNFLPNPLLTK